MGLDLYKSIIDQLPRGTEVDLHKDGEPLMHPKIIEMIEYAKDKGMFVHAVTNGLLLRSLQEDIVHSGLDLLTISIIDDIPTNTINAFYRYKGDGKPFTQLKVYGNHDELPKADKVIERDLHEWTDSEKRESQKPCSKLLDYAAVNWDGSWAICCVDYKREMSPFNVKDVPFEKGLEFNRMIYKWQTEGLFVRPCTNCNYWS